MIKDEGSHPRTLTEVELPCDLAVIGGGLAGVCAAVTAARAGLKVTLVQDRPVLGGNASSEVRLWILGATSHMGNNDRWAREGGIIDEILVENTWRNREGNPILVDALLLEKVVAEERITLLLNTAATDVEMGGDDRVEAVNAFCSQNSTRYRITAPFFCDASGDGIVGFQAGAAFRMGAEARDEFGEGLAPETATRDLLGHSLYFYSRDAGRPVRFVAPSFALRDIKGRIPRIRSFHITDFGCKLWWIEYGGRLDTIHETEEIKWELWRIIYGLWDHVKNSGEYGNVDNLTLEWVGMIPGKRESRRFEGPYMMTQQDLVEQREFPDAVSFGGWAIDHHPPDGVYSSGPGCEQWHTKGVYQIPFSTMYSRNVANLLLTGRIISTSHIAFGSTRVMATCAHNAQAVGMAAVLCRRDGLLPTDLQEPDRMAELQDSLARIGQYIPGHRLDSLEDLARTATIEASSSLSLGELPPDGGLVALDHHMALMVPVGRGNPPKVTFLAKAARDTRLEVELRISSRQANHTPDVELEKITLDVPAGERVPLPVSFSTGIDRECYAFYIIRANEAVSLHSSARRVTGILTLFQNFNKAVAKTPIQEPPEGSGIDRLEFWTPKRRPEGRNPAAVFSPPLECFGKDNLTNGVVRPVHQPNAWVSAVEDEAPWFRLHWDKPQSIRQVDLWFDTDYDHPMESVLMGHPEDVMPFCVEEYTIEDANGNVVHSVTDNHQTRNRIVLPEAVQTRELIFRFRPAATGAPVFGVSCWEKEGV